MSGARIPQALRIAVHQRAVGCCEYCHVHKDDAVTAALLKLNLLERVESREMLVRAGRYPPLSL